MIPSPPIPGPAWPRFQAAVLADKRLHTRLLGTPDAAAFRKDAIILAAELGLPLASAELDAAIAEARHAWLTRHVSP